MVQKIHPTGCNLGPKFPPSCWSLVRKTMTTKMSSMNMASPRKSLKIDRTLDFEVNFLKS